MSKLGGSQAVVVTGVTGEIGASIAETLRISGYFVVGIDKVTPPQDNILGAFIELDLTDFASNGVLQAQVLAKIQDIVERREIVALVNNAATQTVKHILDLDSYDYQESFVVNAIAPVILMKLLFEDLRNSGGTVVNVGSIHSKLTKPAFGAYAASKAALQSLTRTASIEWGSQVTVNSIVPAAIDTAMLRSGFLNSSFPLTDLHKCHPSGKIGTANEVAELVKFLIQSKSPFLNGASIELDGGISGVLHDPSPI